MQSAQSSAHTAVRSLEMRSNSYFLRTVGWMERRPLMRSCIYIHFNFCFLLSIYSGMAVGVKKWFTYNNQNTNEGTRASEKHSAGKDRAVGSRNKGPQYCRTQILGIWNNRNMAQYIWGGANMRKSDSWKSWYLGHWDYKTLVTYKNLGQ